MLNYWRFFAKKERKIKTSNARGEGSLIRKRALNRIIIVHTFVKDRSWENIMKDYIYLILLICILLTNITNVLSLISDSFPGVWEVPLVDYIDTHGGLCNIIDSCAKPNTAEEAFNLLDSNFQRHYKTNKAPFFMLLEEDWLANSIFFEGKVIDH